MVMLALAIKILLLRRLHLKELPCLLYTSALAAEAGIEEGHSRWGIDMDEVEKHILLGFDELVFAQVVQDGVHVQINVVRRVDVSPADQQDVYKRQIMCSRRDYDGIYGSC